MLNIFKLLTIVFNVLMIALHYLKFTLNSISEFWSTVNITTTNNNVYKLQVKKLYFQNKNNTKLKHYA